MRIEIGDRIAYSSDWHFGDARHARILGIDVDEHVDNVIKNVNRQIGKKTHLVLVGDIICAPEYVRYLKQLICDKITVILGNRESLDPMIIKNLINGNYDCPSSMRVGKVLVTHIPPHSSEASKYDGVVHGHYHNDIVYNSNYTNVAYPMTKGVVVWHKALIR